MYQYHLDLEFKAQTLLYHNLFNEKKAEDEKERVLHRE